MNQFENDRYIEKQLLTIYKYLNLVKLLDIANNDSTVYEVVDFNSLYNRLLEDYKDGYINLFDTNEDIMSSYNYCLNRIHSITFSPSNIVKEIIKKNKDIEKALDIDYHKSLYDTINDLMPENILNNNRLIKTK